MNEDSTARFIPSPAEIKAACAEIQQGWTPETRASRSSGMDALQRVEVETVAAADLDLQPDWSRAWAG